MMKKNPIILLACALLLSSLTVLAHQGSFGPNECCFSFVSGRLRKDRVVSYKHTDKRCPEEGVLFKMKNKDELCVDPSQQWVKNLIEAKKRLLSN